MKKILKDWNYLFNEIDNQKLIKKAGKRVDVFALLIVLILIGLPYLLIMFNALYIFSNNTIIFHIFLWTIPIFFNCFISIWHLITYQLLKNYLEDEPILNSTNSKKVFLGGLLNPVTIILSIFMTILVEVIL